MIIETFESRQYYIDVAKPINYSVSSSVLWSYNDLILRHNCDKLHASNAPLFLPSLSIEYAHRCTTMYVRPPFFFCPSRTLNHTTAWALNVFTCDLYLSLHHCFYLKTTHHFLVLSFVRWNCVYQINCMSFNELDMARPFCTVWAESSKRSSFISCSRIPFISYRVLAVQVKL